MPILRSVEGERPNGGVQLGADLRPPRRAGGSGRLGRGSRRADPAGAACRSRSAPGSTGSAARARWAALEPRGARAARRSRGASCGLAGRSRWQLALEVWAFQIATLLAGRLGDGELAAHTVVLNLASLSFMVPLGISIAAVTRVGNLIGAGKPRAGAARGLGRARPGGGGDDGLRRGLPPLREQLAARLHGRRAVVSRSPPRSCPSRPPSSSSTAPRSSAAASCAAWAARGPPRSSTWWATTSSALPLAWWLTFRARARPGRALVGARRSASPRWRLLLVLWIWRRGPEHSPALKREPS